MRRQLRCRFLANEEETVGKSKNKLSEGAEAGEYVTGLIWNKFPRTRSITSLFASALTRPEEIFE